MKRIAYALTLIAAVVALASCHQEETPVFVEEVTVSPTSLTFSPEGETKTFTVKANVAWKVSGEPYMTFSTKGEAASDVAVTVAVTIGKNDTGATREGTITVTVPSGDNPTVTTGQEAFIAPPGLYNAADLNDFAAALTEETPDLSKWTDPGSGEIILYEDIDASALDCFPIEPLPETAVVNGNGKTLTIALSGATEQYLALFKSIKGTVKNLTLSGTVKVDGACPHNSHYAALAGTAIGSTLENVRSLVSIQVKSSNPETSAVHIGGLVGKASMGLTMTGCSNEGEISFTSTGPSYHFAGALIGAYGSAEDTGTVSVRNCSNSGSITLESGDVANWNYAAGLIGNIQGATRGVHSGDAAWPVVLEDCTNAGNITLLGPAKTRLGGVFGRFNTDALVERCAFNGKIQLNACELERNVGGITSFIEKTCILLVKDCVFGGTIAMDNGQKKASYIGGIASSGAHASTVFDGCKTTRKSYVGCSLLGNIGMVTAQGSNALTVKNCKIAGTINAAGEETVITAENLVPWMYLGKNTTKSLSVDGGGNVFNNE